MAAPLETFNWSAMLLDLGLSNVEALPSLEAVGIWLVLAGPTS